MQKMRIFTLLLKDNEFGEKVLILWTEINLFVKSNAFQSFDVFIPIKRVILVPWS
jgi:hypothetical protein